MNTIMNRTSGHPTNMVLCVVLICLCLGLLSANAFLLNRRVSPEFRALSSLRMTNELLPDDFFDGQSVSSKQSSASTPQQPASELQKYFEVVMTKLGKCNKSTLRTLISKYQQSSLPSETEDLETHITLALSVLWGQRNGDWDGLLELAASELDEHVQRADRFLREAVTSGSSMTESRLKELIKLHASANALPKLDKRRFKGKYLSSDYLACLIDVLREKFDGDFQQVAEVIKVESNITRKKGFAEAPAAP